MPATIQTIQKPTRARALDTSMSFQTVTQNLIDTNNDFSADDTWTKGTGWTIGSGVATCDGSQSDYSYLYQADASLNDAVGKHYKITFTITAISAGGVAAQVGGYGPSTERHTTTGTYSEIVGPVHDSANNRIYFSANASFAGSVDNIIVEECENFQSNNHGQIYSGRALEFDGVTDYFLHNGGTNMSGVNSFADGEEWTFATWIYFRDTKFTMFIGENNATHTNIGLHNNDYIFFRADSSNYYKFDTAQTDSSAGSHPLQVNTWYRLTITAKDNILTCYLNGVQHGSTITTSTNDSGNTTAFPGSASDFACWGMP